ncbi:MAG: DUF3035 domain-containing protein [Marinovum algicola]|jgi:hypothetical protein|uniref:Beta-barrel assembly machine subunit BamF n=1 Tax=Marinovum algicola TaxID=42444 RepID=A0A975ZQH5_9RHOB|nr:DUF3035 domain-containing protein [Marinovum algicola]SEK05807.1 Beta-barrel assembly machine subunit BamF [Marinovum algicola]SLN72419.1 hypothetical protein MAA5396_04049 [Marinovum algicola]
MTVSPIAKRCVLLALALGLAACGERDITLHELRVRGDGPEEFAIVPPKPLQTPESFDALPPPTPGAANRTDPTPEADAVAALGGDGARVAPRAAGAAAGDGALVSYAARNGVQPGIRAQLAAEDLEFRKRASRFTWQLMREDKYYDAYERFAIDPYEVLRLFRRAGVRTPAADPTEERNDNRVGG